MIAGVRASILAAVAALPFTLPAGWFQLPQYLTSAGVANVWHTGNGKTQQTFTAVSFPFVGSLQMLAASGMKAGSLVKIVSITPVSLCGTSGRLVISRLRSRDTAGMLEQIVTVKNSHAYLLMYLRPMTAPADPRIVQVMRGFCPSGTGEVAQLSPPRGWTASGEQLRVVGVWMGPHLGQVLTLMRGTPTASLDKLLGSAAHQLNKIGNTPLHYTSRNVTMCGYPGVIADMRTNVQKMPMQMYVAVTQGAGAAYVLMYAQMDNAPTDAGAMSALRTLCAAPTPGAPPTATPSGVPSVSPSASHSAAPSGTPSPAAKPSPGRQARSLRPTTLRA